MPNIAITTYCNLHCPYCFAQQMFKDENIKNMSIERFDEILKWLEPYVQENHCRIGIIGGEPTLHPQFEEIMEHISFFCEKYNCSSILFTNGIELTEKLLKTIPDKMHILVNYNHPSVYSQDKIKQLNDNLELCNTLGYFYNKIMIGTTICQQIDDYQYFKDIIKKYNLDHIRLAVDRANGKWDIKEYYLKMKYYFLDLINFLNKQENFQTLHMDCRIPIDYFNIEEQKAIFQIMPKEIYTAPCCPAYEILPDFTMTSCFTHYKPINCQDYQNYKQFRESLIIKENI